MLYYSVLMSGYKHSSTGQIPETLKNQKMQGPFSNVGRWRKFDMVKLRLLRLGIVGEKWSGFIFCSIFSDFFNLRGTMHQSHEPEAKIWRNAQKTKKVLR